MKQGVVRAVLVGAMAIATVVGLCGSAGAVLHETIRLTASWSLRNLLFLQPNPIRDDSTYAHARLREEVVAI